MSDVIAPTRGLDIGRALGDAFSLIRRRLPVVLGLVLLLAWGPQLLVIFGYFPVFATAGPLPHGPWPSLGFALLILFVGLFMRAAVTALALAPEQDASPFRAVAAAVGAIPALFPLWLIATTPEVVRVALRALSHIPLAQQAIVVAAVSWLITIILALTLGVASAVAVGEQRGFATTVMRTARLMSAGRWAFLGLFLVFQLLAGVSATGAVLGLSTLRLSGFDPTEVLQVRSAALELLSDALQALWAVVAAMCYRQFRRQLDGATAEEAADIFG